MPIILRTVKGEPLTNAEIDGNFAYLDDIKLEASVLNENNAMLVRDNGGNITKIVVPLSRIVGRLASGEIKALTVNEVKGLLEIAIEDIDGLQATLDAKAGTDLATTTEAGLMGTVDKSKLDGIENGATANDTDANLKDRSNHTGEQEITTVTGLQDALNGKQAAIVPDSGWFAPTGLSSKNTYDTDTVTTQQLAQRVKAIYEALVSLGILTEGA